MDGNQHQQQLAGLLELPSFVSFGFLLLALEKPHHSLLVVGLCAIFIPCGHHHLFCFVGVAVVRFSCQILHHSLDGEAIGCGAFFAIAAFPTTHDPLSIERFWL